MIVHNILYWFGQLTSHTANMWAKSQMSKHVNAISILFTRSDRICQDGDQLYTVRTHLSLCFDRKSHAKEKREKSKTERGLLPSIRNLEFKQVSKFNAIALIRLLSQEESIGKLEILMVVPFVKSFSPSFFIHVWNRSLSLIYSGQVGRLLQGLYSNADHVLNLIFTSLIPSGPDKITLIFFPLFSHRDPVSFFRWWAQIHLSKGPRHRYTMEKE